MKLKRLWPVWLCLILLLSNGLGMKTAVAQTEPELRLSLSRDFGTGLGNNIQGTFSYRVTGPDNLIRVSFYIDDQLVGEDSEAPFRWQFDTEDFPLGVHTLRAVGTTQDGQTLHSNSLTRNFISGSSANRAALYIIIPIILLGVGGRLLSAWIANRGQKADGAIASRAHGAFGGTVCPKCGNPFALHFWGPNILVGKLDRCPHCRKWSVVRRLPPAQLNAAAEKMRAAVPGKKPQSEFPEDEDSRQRQLDESKYDS